MKTLNVTCVRVYQIRGKGKNKNKNVFYQHLEDSVPALAECNHMIPDLW